MRKFSLKRDDIQKILLAKEKELAFEEGFKLLYCPWERINSAQLAFLSLNPGRPPNQESLRVVSDERGNSYVVEREINKSPITEQYLKFCELLGVNPNAVLSGVIFPFRSNAWKSLTIFQRQQGLALGSQLWKSILHEKIRLVVAVGNETAKILIDIFDAKKEKCVPSGWGNISLRRFIGHNGVKIVQLPHLSRFKLLSNDRFLPPLKEVFEGTLGENI